MVLLISYDLKGASRDYSKLHNEIKKARAWWHYLESTWIISTNHDTEQWQRRLRRHIEKNDNLLVIEVCRNYQGWLPERAWVWLNKREFRC